MPSSPHPTLFPYTTLFRSVLLEVPLESRRRLPHQGLERGQRVGAPAQAVDVVVHGPGAEQPAVERQVERHGPRGQVVAVRRLLDRKSTRLNSSHVSISYAVFTASYTLSLHDALPICTAGSPPRIAAAPAPPGPRTRPAGRCPGAGRGRSRPWPGCRAAGGRTSGRTPRPTRSGSSGPTSPRSEEHTSELQSRFDLVCRLHRILHSFPTRRSSDLYCWKSPSNRGGACPTRASNAASGSVPRRRPWT